MAGVAHYFQGQLSWLRMAFCFMLVLMMTLVLSREFRDWVVSNAAAVSFDVELSSNDFFLNVNTTNISVVVRHRLNTTDSMPSICEFPKVKIYEPSVVKIAGLNKKVIKCEGTFMPDLTYITGSNKLSVNASQVKDHLKGQHFQHCRYRNISRHDSDDNQYTFGEWSPPFNDTIELSNNTEFLKVECTNNISKIVSKTFYYLIPKKEEFNETDYLNLKKRQVISSPKETLNIIMFGLDSLPRNQFIRACTKTYSYLMNTLNSFDLTLHSQLAPNTFPNFVSLFTDHSYDEVNKWWTMKNHMDTFDTLWHTFEKAGYRTLYTEDSPKGGAFHYERKGFVYPLARYHIRPLMLAMYDDPNIYKHSIYCAGNQMEMVIQLDYVKKLLETFPDDPVFAVIMSSRPTHDYPEDLSMFDEHLLRVYQSWASNGYLNRTLLVTFSDHGLRFVNLRNTKNGHFESRTPLAIWTFPEWFLKKYPDVAANLRVNTKRLTSHFDTRATLLDLLYFKSNSPPPLAPLKRGISLFEKIPWDRTCNDAEIPSDYCLCGYKDLEEINISSHLSQKVTTLVVEALNLKTDKSVCAVYKLVKIITVLKTALSQGNPADKIKTVVYKVKLEVNPGNAVFVASVYTKPNSPVWTVGDNIDRVSAYGRTADCLSDPTNRPYCYCLTV